jgi:DNA-binding ferritin-like protein (Dps family)
MMLIVHKKINALEYVHIQKMYMHMEKIKHVHIKYVHAYEKIHLYIWNMHLFTKERNKISI